MGLASYVAVDMIVDVEAVEGLLEGSKLLVWIPMRLGLESVAPTHQAPLVHLLGTRYCLGMAGGRPNSALYFVAFRNGHLLYLDPHHPRPAVRAAPEGPLSEEEMQSYQCRSLGQIALGSIDPCFAVGFLLPDRAALPGWRAEMEQITTQDGVPLISFARGAPPSTVSHVVDIDEDLVAIDLGQ